MILFSWNWNCSNILAFMNLEGRWFHRFSPIGLAENHCLLVLLCLTILQNDLHEYPPNFKFHWDQLCHVRFAMLLALWPSTVPGMRGHSGLGWFFVAVCWTFSKAVTTSFWRCAPCLDSIIYMIYSWIIIYLYQRFIQLNNYLFFLKIKGMHDYS